MQAAAAFTRSVVACRHLSRRRSTFNYSIRERIPAAGKAASRQPVRPGPTHLADSDASRRRCWDRKFEAARLGLSPDETKISSRSREVAARSISGQQLACRPPPSQSVAIGRRHQRRSRIARRRPIHGAPLWFRTQCCPIRNSPAMPAGHRRRDVYISGIGCVMGMGPPLRKSPCSLRGANSNQRRIRRSAQTEPPRDVIRSPLIAFVVKYWVSPAGKKSAVLQYCLHPKLFLQTSLADSHSLSLVSEYTASYPGLDASYDTRSGNDVGLFSQSWEVRTTFVPEVTATDDVTTYVTHGIFNTDLLYSCAHFVLEIDD